MLPTPDLYHSPTDLYYLWRIYMQSNSLPAGSTVVVLEIKVSPVTLYTNQSSAHKLCFIRHYMQDENENDIQYFLKTFGFHQKYSDIKITVSILKHTVLSQELSPPANHSNFHRRDLQFVMSQIQENNFVVQTSRSL